MTSRQIFQLDQNKVLFMKEILAHPVYQEAVAIASQETVPREPQPIPGVDLCHQMTIEGAKAIGANNYRFLLSTLGTIPPPKEESVEEGHHELAVKQMLASGIYRDRTEVEAILKSNQ